MNTYLVKQYFRYLLSAQSGKGHGIHSPFLYALVRDVFMNKHKPVAFDIIEDYRAVLAFDKTRIEYVDFGVGSQSLRGNKRRVCDIARTSVARAKYSQLLFRLAQYFKPHTIVELGTSLGITTSYLATACEAVPVYSIEACTAVAHCAEQTFSILNKHNVHMHHATFAEALPDILQKLGKVDFVFIDGNHSKDATIEHFEMLLPYVHPNTVLIFDDIYWSEGMTQAWQYIKQHSHVSLTVDVFQFGIVLFRRTIAKQHFVVRF